MEPITVYQKPTCSKCQNLMQTLRERQVAFDKINYYETPLSSEGLKELLAKLHLTARDILRTSESIYQELSLGQKNVSDDELIQLMIQYPDLMQRPIVVKGDKAVIAREPGKIDELITDVNP